MYTSTSGYTLLKALIPRSQILLKCLRFLEHYFLIGSQAGVFMLDGCVDRVDHKIDSFLS